MSFRMDAHSNEPPHIFTTVRFDSALRDCTANTAASNGLQSSVYLLQYHYDRLQEAATALGGYDGAMHDGNILTSPKSLELAILEALKGEHALSTGSEPHREGPFRVRLALRRDGSVDVQCPKIPQTRPMLFPESLDHHSSTTWTVCLDDQPTAKDVHTSFKTSQRQAYDRARQSAGCNPADTKEVLLYDSDGDIIDASITTPYLYRDGRWMTPPASAGGQQGTTRRWALANELCVERDVSLHSLREGEMVWLSNAARGFFVAKLTLAAERSAPPV